MSSSTRKSDRRASRGWWRLLAAILFAVAATLGLGFYLPLRQSHDLLVPKLSAAQASNGELGDQLRRAQMALKSAQAEREELLGFKAKVDTAEHHFVDLAERFKSEAKPALQPALASKQIRVEPLQDGISIAWLDASLLDRTKSAAGRKGASLLCPQVQGAAALELGRVAVHTFVAADALDLQAGFTQATALAVTLANQVREFCAIPAGKVSVVTSVASADAPLLRLEFVQTGSAVKTN